MEAGTSESQTQSQSAETFYRFLAWLHANQKRLYIVAGIIAGIGLIAGLMAWNKAQAAATANARLNDLPLGTAPNNMPTASAPPSAYLDLAQRYPDTTAGEYAALLGAESLFVNGDYAQAQQQFSKYIEDHPESALVAEAKVGVAACQEAQGKSADAIQSYSSIISTYPSDINISEPARLTLARLEEQANRPDQALTLYSELARSQNPYDPWAAEARDRGELLLAKHPELRRAGQAPAPAAAAPAPFSIGQPVKAPDSTAPAAAPPATTPAPQQKPAGQGLNLLNFPGATSNATGKP